MNNNTGFTPTNTPSTLFPPLESTTDNEQPQQLLWNNVNTFAIPDDSADESSNSSSPPTTNIIYPTGSPAPAALASVKVIPDNAEQGSSTGGVFNISWGGTDDKPPSDLHPNEQQEEPIKLSRPLPKPRGVRKLPEPEPSEDGTIDEDTLKRRKNTDAARRSRMKKFLKVDQLENRVAALQAENAKLILSNAVLESEKRSLNAKEKEYKKRIRYLEETMMRNGWEFDCGTF